MKKLHALNPRPSEEEAYDLLSKEDIENINMLDYEGLEIDDILYIDDWDKDWPTDASIRARQQWDKLAKQWKVFPIVKYWFDVTMHKKYAPGGAGYFQVKADFVARQVKMDPAAEFWSGIKNMFDNTGIPASLRTAIVKKNKKDKAAKKCVEFFTNHCSNTKCTYMPGHKGLCSFQVVSGKRARN